MTSSGNGLDDDCNSATDDDINDDDDSTMGNDEYRRSWSQGEWATLLLHNNQMIRHGLMSFGAANEYHNGQGKVACM
jgi:hypothetical protein